MGQASRDQNFVTTLLAVSNVDGVTPVTLYADPVTHRLLVDVAGGTGTVTSVSVVTANGFAGSVATATTTPAITLTTSVTGIIKGNGTAMSAATAGTDYADASFKTIAVSGQSDVVADSAADTLTLVAGTNVTITTNASTDTITINASAGASGITVGTTTITSGTNTRILYNNSGVVGEYTLQGSGTAVVMATSPTLTTPVLGVATATSINGLTISTTTGTFTLTNAKTFAVTNTLTLSGTDSTIMTFPTTSATIARTDAANTFTGNQTFSGTVILGTQSITMTGSLAATGARVTKGWFTDVESTNMPTVGGTAILTSLTAPQFTTIELGNASDTTLSRSSGGVLAVEGVVIPSISSTNTITNKRNQPRITSAASYTTDTGTSLDVSTTDIFVITAQAGALLFNAPGGTPVQGEKLIIRIKDNGSARALTYNAVFRASSDLALPTTTVLSKTLYMGFIYNSTDTKWDLLAVLNNI